MFIAFFKNTWNDDCGLCIHQDKQTAVENLIEEYDPVLADIQIHELGQEYWCEEIKTVTLKIAKK